MPVPVQIIIWVAASLTALGVIWSKVVKPFVAGLLEAQVTRPVIRALVDEFQQDIGRLETLGEIAEQFRNNNGSSLRDGFDRIEKAQAALKIATETEIRVAREQMAHVAARVDRIDAAAMRIEAAAGIVAVNLASAHARADQVDTSAPAGEASDAGARSEPPK